MSEMEVPEGWNKVSIKSISSLITKGSTPTTYGYSFTTEGIPFLRAEDVLENRLNLHPKKFISKETHDFFKRSKIKSNDVLLTIAGTIGRSAVVPKNSPEFNSNQAIAIIRLKNTCNSIFLSYFLNSNLAKIQIIGSKVTTSIPNLSLSMIEKITLPLPPLIIQQEIIQKLDHILEQLEEKKKQIFLLITKNNERIKFFQRNWFSYLIDSEIENHPQRKEWKTVLLTDIVSPEKHALKSGPFGSSLKKEFYVPKGYKIYGQEQVIRGDPEYGDYFIDENRFQMLKSCEVKPDDLLISLVGTIGKTLVLPPNAKKGIINPRLIKISFNKQLADVNYFQFYFASSTAKSHFKSESHGGTMNILNLRILKELPIPLPPLSIQKQIVQNIKNAEEKFKEQKNQFEKIKQNYESRIKYINHIQSSILDSAFAGKLVN